MDDGQGSDNRGSGSCPGTALDRLWGRYRHARFAPDAVCYYAGHPVPVASAVKQFLEFVPLLLFFLIYKLEPRTFELAGHAFDVGGTYSATAVLIISSSIVAAALLLRYRKLEKSQWIALIACLLFGGLTLALHSETILKWKAPVVNGIFAAAFAASHFIGKQPIIQRLMGHAVSLPAEQWARLNLAWVLFFLVSGFSNLFVAFVYPAIWVDFKVFGSLGMTLLFMLGQGLYLYRYLQEPQTNDLKE